MTIRNLKILGLACIVTLALNGVAASASKAQTAFHFTASSGTSILTGVTDPGSTTEVTTDSGSVTCLKDTYTGTITGPTASTFRLSPKYTECHLINVFTFKAEIDPEGCELVFHAVTKINGKYEGSMDIECPVGKSLTITMPGCEITYPSQTGLKEVTYTTIGSGSTKELTIDVDLTGVTYVEDNGGFCLNNAVLTHNGTVKSKINVTAQQNNNHVSIGEADT